MKIGVLEKKKIIIDIFLNIIATAIPTLTLHLLIVPLLSGYMSDDEYGLLVTLLALLNVVPSTMGNALNNIRLICGVYDGENGFAKDYNVILLVMTGINICIVVIFYWFYKINITIVDLLLTLIVSILWLCREYYIVAFRIKINYKFVMISNLMMTVGYGVGLIIFKIIGYWQMIYILGYSVNLIFIFSKSDLWKEPIKVSYNFRKISWQTALLILSNVLNRITIYADKILIFPVLGGASVSVYYAATLFGKVISMAITPVSGVLLSYLSKEEKRDDNIFNMMLFSSTVICVIGYCVCLSISRPVLKFVYPQFADDAMKYIVWTTGTVVLTALISVINPFVMRFFDMKWQIVLNGGATIVYIGLSMSLLSIFGLTGFCIGAFLTNVIKVIFIILIYNSCKKVKTKTTLMHL